MEQNFPDSDEIQKLDENEISFFLSKEGPFAKTSENYEERPVQIQLLKKITETFNKNKIGIFEAGTGVGKSFSYLIPSMFWALKNKERVVISTGTINLQQQIVEKDIPLAEKFTGLNIKAVLVKGRQNYVCLRRLDELGKERDLFDEEQDTFDKIIKWAKKTDTGSRSDISFMPPENIWQKINSEADACMGARCPFREKCFVMKVRKEAADADLLVVNHHLLFADIESRLSGAGFEDTAVLPPYRHLIFDEAHGIEDAATSFFSSAVNRFKILKQLNLMYRQRKNSATGFIFVLSTLSMNDDNTEEILENIEKIKGLVQILENETLEFMGNESSFRLYEKTSGRFQKILLRMEELSSSIGNFTGSVRKLIEGIPEEAAEEPVLYETKAVLRRLEDIVCLLNDFQIWDEKQDSVFWLQKTRLSSAVSRGLDSPFFVQFYKTPLDIAPLMSKGVFEPMDNVVCTSATIGTGGNFYFWKKRTGVSFIEKERISEGEFLSPFPYSKNVLFSVVKDVPFPENPSFQDSVESALIKLILASKGRTLVLFTSYESLRHACAFVRSAFAKSPVNIFRQGDDDRFRLLSAFKEDVSSVLFATDSFWEGVDIPGESLSQVIIVKLPFGVPGDPVFAAKSEQIQKNGGNSFMELSVPESIIKFRQGFGRLVRRSDDKGSVVVLDRRIIERQYGRIFLESIPETKRLYDSAEAVSRAVEKFLE